MQILIRDERGTDGEAIGYLIVSAYAPVEYSSHDEQSIVARLRAAGALTLSLLAESAGELLGYVAVSAVSVSDGARGWYALGPLAVRPASQRRGVGEALVKAALKRLQQMQAAGCVVLGDPGYYSRFGFVPVAGLQLAETQVPQEYFQALSFGMRWPQGLISYHEAFGQELPEQF